MACVCGLAAIEKFCGGPNAPGLKRTLEIACTDDVTTIPAATDHVISTNLTMASAKTFFAWSFSKDDSSYVSEKDENGLWNTTVTIFIPKLEAVKTEVLTNANGDNFITRVRDMNNQPRLIGALDNGCSVGVREQTNPRNGYVVTITWQSEHAPYFYTGTITV